jgi:hypothetical protein
MDSDALILREDDRVEAWGRLVRTEAGAFLDPPVPVLLFPTPLVRPPTGFGVRVVGADFDDVEHRKEYGERVEGFATLRGRWVDEQFRVDSQTPRRLRGPSPGPAWVTPPCPPPLEGWAHGARDTNLDYDLGDLKDSGAAVAVTLFRPSATQVVLVVAADDPAAVEARLGPQLGGRLCIVASRYSRAEINSVREDLVRRTGWPIWATGESCDDEGQPVVTVELTRVRPDFAAWLANQPEGLVHVEAWLTPQCRDLPGH